MTSIRSGRSEVVVSPQLEEYRAKARKYREKLRAAGDPVPATAEDFRKADQFMDLLTGEPHGVDYAEGEVGGVAGLWVTPHQAAPSGALLYLHGGGYVMGSSSTHRKMVGHLATAAGVRAFIPDYRLAPEHPYPAAVEDGVAVFRGLLAEGNRPERILMGGDSAGGGLALAVTLALRNDGRPTPRALLLLSPWTDLAFTGPSLQGNAESDLTMTLAAARKMAEYYCGRSKPRAPLVSPLYADLRGLPPTYIQVGGDEMLLDDAVRIDERLRAARVDSRIDIAPGMQHVFQFGAGTIPEADEAVERLGSFARQQLG